MKRIGFFVGIVLLQFVLFLAVTSAVSCTNQNQRMLRISSVSNAHGELYDGAGSYTEEVCFNNYFQNSGNGVRTCSTNKLIRLSASTNAHGEILTQTTAGYADVCYGDLTCQIISSGNCNDTLGNSYSVIASLSSQTNAHISLGNLYNYQICCRSASSQPICNYNGICEGSETEFNCPGDCRVVCGDGAVTGSEVCDGTNLDGETCAHFNPSSFYGGALACVMSGALECKAFDLTGCLPHQCGDGIVTGSETCDGTNLSGQTCPFGGSLSCIAAGAANECTLDSSLCTGPVCGDDIKSGAEECDGDNETGDWGSVNGCSDLSGYSGGNLSCSMSGTDMCTFNVSECIPASSFCEENAPFDYTINGTAYVPNNCDEYNKVYPTNESARYSLCINNCIPGASDPVNNGVYGGVAQSAGCSWDSNQKKCFFNYTTFGGQSCRIDYLSEGACNPDSPFRSVVINSTNIGGTSGSCDAGCGTSQCETTIPCPKMIELPFFGFLSALLSAIIIAFVYSVRKK